MIRRIPPEILARALNPDRQLARRVDTVERSITAMRQQTGEADRKAEATSNRVIGPYPDPVSYPKDASSYVWEATSDAAWNAESGYWEVTAQRIKLDGTLDTTKEATQPTLGAETDSTPVASGDRVIDSISAEGRWIFLKLSTFSVRGTEGLFKFPILRAYLTADDSLVPPDTEYDSGTMYLFLTWDYPRERVAS